MTDLRGKVAIVTGAASGIGCATALAMASAGAAVAVADINRGGADEVVGEIGLIGGEGLAISVDVSEAEQVEAMVVDTVKRFGRLDVLFNNAAILAPEVRAKDTDVVTLDLDVWERTMAVNLRGTMLGCRFAIPEMRRTGGGSIVNASSGAADLADVVRCAYGTSKGAINTLTRYVAAGFGKEGIRCNAIAPGVVVTPAVTRLWSKDALLALTEHHMAPRLGSPADIAPLVVYLASDDSAFLTGQVLTVDGGLSGHMPTYGQTMKTRAAQQTNTTTPQTHHHPKEL